MITRFNKYEQKLNEESAFPDWVEQKLSKSAKKFFAEQNPTGAYETLMGQDKLDATITKLYNSPLKDMRLRHYVQLTGLMKEEELNTLQLEEPLTVDSTMLEIANNYYIKNIIEIINEIVSFDVKFATQGLDKTIIDELQKNPITIGTIITNSLINWYDSGEPTNSLVASLSKKVLEPEYAKANESYEINERFGELKGLFKGFFKKSGENIKGFIQGEKGIAKGASVLDDEVDSVAKGLQKVEQSASKSSTQEITNTSRNTPEFLQGKNEILSQGENAYQEGKILKYDPVTKHIDFKGPSKAGEGRTTPSVESKIPDNTKTDALNSQNTSSVKETDDLVNQRKFLEKQEKIADKQIKADDKRAKVDRAYAEKLEKRRIREARAAERRKILWDLVKGPTKFIFKWGALGLGLMWVYEWFTKNDEKSGKTPVKEVLSVFELEMANDNYQPFATFSSSAKVVEQNSASGQPSDICKGFVEALQSTNIMSESNAEKCLEQIKSPGFDAYIQSLSEVSGTMIQNLENRWNNSFELPTSGLKAIGLISAYAAIFNRFENELYGGKIPLTADENNLDKPVGMIKRFDEKGDQRQYMQIGDTGNDVKQLQMSLKKIHLYDGEVDGVYDEELAKLIAGIQTNAASTTDKVQINGRADIPTLAYLAKQIELLSMVTPSLLTTQVNPEEIQRRGEVQGYIQQMQSALETR